MNIWYTQIESPIDRILLTSDGESLTGLHMMEHRHYEVLTDDWKRDDDIKPFAESREQLAAYFAGELSEFDLPLNLLGTEFQQGVWRELQNIPYGLTISYGELANRIGNPNSSRAVGLANGHNPISIIVPCHRVIGANGKLTGYGGGIKRKEWLLAHETKHKA